MLDQTGVLPEAPGMSFRLAFKILWIQIIEKADITGAGRLADLKISKSALLSLNHHNFSNTEPIYTK